MLKDYPVFNIGDGMWEINEYDGVSMFLICGSQRALLIDTGAGIGDLRAFVESKVSTPYDVLLTHNHRDHTGNSPQFDKVYMSRVDTGMGALVRPWTSKESRLSYVNNTRKNHPETDYPWTDADLTEFTADNEPEIIPIEDGHVFDLGDRRICCFLAPGHTPGSLMAIDSKTGTLFSADCVNGTVGIGVRPIDGMKHASVTEALAALKRVWAMDFDRSRVFNAHTDSRCPGEPLGQSIYPSVMRAMDMICEGSAEVKSQYIPVINTTVESTVIDGVRIQFHCDNIK